jgi:ABC-type multidrug transport system permease subunit
MRISAVLWHEWTLFKKRFWNITISNIVSPMLYLVAFGWGLGNLTVEGMSYIDFIIPGIIAMTTMSACFNEIAFNINIARFYDKTFEEYMSAPIRVRSYALGKIISSSLYGFYIAMLIVLLTAIAGKAPQLTPWFFFIVLLNCLVFSAIGFAVGVSIQSHSDIGKFSNFIITPMSFLCGTFFSLEKMPVVLNKLIMALPLSQTTTALRGVSESMGERLIHVLILCAYFCALLWFGIRKCRKLES